jgi:hypothetical protein
MKFLENGGYLQSVLKSNLKSSLRLNSKLQTKPASRLILISGQPLSPEKRRMWVLTLVLCFVLVSSKTFANISLENLSEDLEIEQIFNEDFHVPLGSPHGFAPGTLSTDMARTPTITTAARTAATTSKIRAPSALSQDDVIKAQTERRGLDFTTIDKVLVAEVLPDDLNGRTHQKWIVQLKNGSRVLCVYNTDVSDRVPLKIGDTVTLAGQYIWDRGGGLIHWLHEDPKDQRPDGYVELNGIKYGKFK